MKELGKRYVQRLKTLGFIHSNIDLIIKCRESTERGEETSFKIGTVHRQLVERAIECVGYSRKTIPFDIYHSVFEVFFAILFKYITVHSDGRVVFDLTQKKKIEMRMIKEDVDSWPKEKREYIERLCDELEFRNVIKNYDK